jgi:UDP-GlcNAc3NAcA epimerase
VTSMRLLSIVGARPQFVKMAVVCRAAATLQLDHIIIHTGQHYDPRMSEVFFQELDIPVPDHCLEVGSGTHAVQTAAMLERLEPILLSEDPDWVLLYGDTNSTLAGAIAASKIGQRIAHIESGLRSFNRRVPEELNRVATDHLSDLLLCPTQTAMDNLRREGLADRAVLTGDVMYDAYLADIARAEQQNGLCAGRWASKAFALATVHRAENTDDPQRLTAIMNTLDQVSADICPVVIPLHPRTRKALLEANWSPRNLLLTEPVSYLQMIFLERRARMIFTDSGGVQKEAYFGKVPCITLREQTEWVETLENGCNVLVGASHERSLEAASKAPNAGPWRALYGDGNAGTAIVEQLMKTREQLAGF